jgi:hypothetical protein
MVKTMLEREEAKNTNRNGDEKEANMKNPDP